MRVFSVNAWRFAASVGAGKWDRFTSYGIKVKDGVESVFDETTLGQMIDNFAARKNDIAMCYDHQSAYVEENGQPAPALAFYNALALVVDGKVVKFATHSPDVQPPAADGLENGVYGYRSELTPLGEKLLPNYKYLSPMFTDQGEDEKENPIGYDLIDVAATNTPFQDGVGLTFHMSFSPGSLHEASAEDQKQKQSTGADRALGENMDDLYKKLGLADGASADEMKGAMAKYMAEQDEKAKAFADMEEKLKKFDVDPSNAAQNAAVHIKTGNVHDEGGRKHSKMDDKDGDEDQKMDEDKEAIAKMAKDLGLEPGAPASKVYAAYSAKTVPVSTFAKAEQRLAVIEAERAAEKKAERERQYAELADRGIASGYAKDKRDHLIAFARADFKAASEFVETLPGSKIFTRFTKGGGPLDAPRGEQDPVHAEIGGSRIPVRTATFAAKARKYAREHKLDGIEGLKKAQKAVLAEDPAAAEDLLGR